MGKKWICFIGSLIAFSFSACSENEMPGARDDSDLEFDETQPMTIIASSTPAVSVKGSGPVGGIGSEDDPNIWRDEEVRIYAVNRDYMPHDLSLSSDAPLGDGIVVSPAADDTLGRILMKYAGGAPIYYPRSGRYNFFGLYTDDASGVETGIYDSGYNAYYVNFVIDGTQDLMIAKAVSADSDGLIENVPIEDELYMFSAISSRMGYFPFLKFEHMLTRLRFFITNGQNTKSAHEVYVKDIEVKSYNKGRLYFITPDDMLPGNIVWSGDEPVSMVLKERHEDGSMNLLTSRENSHGILVSSYPTKADLIQGVENEGLIWNEVKDELLGFYHLDEDNLSEDVLIGNSLLVAPGMGEYEMDITFRQYFDSKENAIPSSIGEFTFEDVKIRTGNGDSFLPGYSYDILISVNDLKEIEIGVSVSEWGNDVIEVDPLN